MLDRNLILQFLRDHRDELQSEYLISKIGLIGSSARGEQTEKSDIDILFEFQPDTDNIFEKKSDLRAFFKTVFSTGCRLVQRKVYKTVY